MSTAHLTNQSMFLMMKKLFNILSVYDCIQHDYKEYNVPKTNNGRFYQSHIHIHAE